MRTKRFEDESRSFGAKLKLLRKRAGLSVEDLAQAALVAPTTYREWENGRAITGLPYKALAMSLGVSVASLFDENRHSGVTIILEAVAEIDLAVKKIKELV